MKITIDTKEDTQEEILKAIRLLSSLVGDKEIISNNGDLFSGDSPDLDSGKSPDLFADTPSDSGNSDDNPQGSSGGGIFNMFNAGSGSGSSPETKTGASEQEPDDKSEDFTIDIPEVEEYR
jgi:hypothetical protein